MMMSWTDSNAKCQQWPEDLFNVQILQQPVKSLCFTTFPNAPQATTIFQQFPGTEASCFAPGCPGHIRKDLVELMMIQKAQMHQIIINKMTMFSTLSTTHTPENARINMDLEEEPDVYTIITPLCLAFVTRVGCFFLSR